MERKRLEDYLHLYLGCLVELDNGGSKVYNRKLIAVGGVDDAPYAKLRMGKAGKGQYVHAVLLSENRIKPILRKLSDMTAQEWGEHGLRFSLDVFESVRSPNLKYSDRPKHVLVLENRLQTNTLRFNDGMILLGMGFDLFNLIESGLAIDASTIKP